MEVISVHVDNYDPAAGILDDLGGGKIYANLIKSAVYKVLGISHPVSILSHGGVNNTIGVGAEGAVIADTSIIKGGSDNLIPITFIAPAGFSTNLEARIASSTGKTSATCTVGEFLDALCDQCDATPVARWNTFASWFNTYIAQLNDSGMGDTDLLVTTIDGNIFEGVGVTCPTVSVISDIFRWIKSMMPTELIYNQNSCIIYNEIATYLFFEFYLSGLSGDYESYTGRTDVRISWSIRL